MTIRKREYLISIDRKKKNPPKPGNKQQYIICGRVISCSSLLDAPLEIYERL